MNNQFMSSKAEKGRVVWYGCIAGERRYITSAVKGTIFGNRNYSPSLCVKRPDGGKLFRAVRCSCRNIGSNAAPYLNRAGYFMGQCDTLKKNILFRMQSNARVVIKLILLPFSATAGLLILLFWESASHSHLQLREDKPEDWIILTLLIILFGLPLYYLVNCLINKRRSK